MMNLAMMSFDVVPGVMVGLLGPAVGVVAAVALSVVTYGFVALAVAGLRRPGRPRRDTLATPVAPVRRPEWEITPTIALMLRTACEQQPSR